mmetsp:Transcript_30596/g.44947  ORF Transcript_30596/g.44947 Transcript_30596/m.44947 type:complete len:132 (-) Transcript_30596:321-716(-)
MASEMASLMEMASEMALLVGDGVRDGVIDGDGVMSGFLMWFYLCPSGEDVILFTQVTCGMGCFDLPILSFRGGLLSILSFRGGGFAQRLALRMVLPVAHVLQEVYEVHGFPRPKSYMAKYSVVYDAPTRRI